MKKRTLIGFIIFCLLSLVLVLASNEVEQKERVTKEEYENMKRTLEEKLFIEKNSRIRLQSKVDYYERKKRFKR